MLICGLSWLSVMHSSPLTPFDHPTLFTHLRGRGVLRSSHRQSLGGIMALSIPQHLGRKGADEDAASNTCEALPLWGAAGVQASDDRSCGPRGFGRRGGA